MTTCPWCREPLAAGQEYCLECGLRQSGHPRLGPLPTETRALRMRIAGLAAVACVGAVVAIAVAADDTGAQEVRTATGGSVTVPARALSPKSRLAVWPSGRSGWTIVLVSTPKARGEDEAVAVAQQARLKGLSGVGSTGDSGVSTRLFGTLLTWLSDHESDVFFVATSNDISKLPPEFARAERFDGVFFLDLPAGKDRQANRHGRHGRY